MPTPEETMAYNNQQAYNSNINQQVDQARMMADSMQDMGNLIGLISGRTVLGPEDRVRELLRLRDFVSMKQPADGYDPQMQLESIDSEIARLSRPPKPAKPLVQSAEDNQRGR